MSDEQRGQKTSLLICDGLNQHITRENLWGR